MAFCFLLIIIDSKQVDNLAKGSPFISVSSRMEIWTEFYPKFMAFQFYRASANILKNQRKIQIEACIHVC